MTKQLKNGKPRKFQSKRKNGRRSNADVVQAQGAGKAVQRAFGSTSGYTDKCWDAFHAMHLPLPRPVAPYTVVRTTRLISSDAYYNQIGSFQAQDDVGKPCWCNIGMVSSVAQASAINATSNAYRYTVPFPGAGESNGSTFSCTPSAISVQVMNTNPLTTTSGLVAGTVCNTQLDLSESSDTWLTKGAEVISYMRPRLMTAGKLALRGVQADSMPMNMNAISDFLPLVTVGDGTFSWNGTTIDPIGWAPIVIVNQDSIMLNYLITIEWRVRFDISNPAVASHKFHGFAPESTWAGLIAKGVNKANGIMDIVEKVANSGVGMAQTTSRALALMG